MESNSPATALLLFYDTSVTSTLGKTLANIRKAGSVPNKSHWWILLNNEIWIFGHLHTYLN
jgi:hypothetical protein